MNNQTIPFNAYLYFKTALRVSSLIKSPLSFTGLSCILCSSHSIGALEDFTMSITDCEISGPIPCPGKRTTLKGPLFGSYAFYSGFACFNYKIN